MNRYLKSFEPPKVALALMLVCGAATSHTSQAQALYNGQGGLVALTDSVRYVRGDVENAGEFDLTSAAGSPSNRLFIDEGNLLNTANGTWIAAKSTVVLMGMTPHVLSMNGATLYNLRLDNPAGTSLGSDVTVVAGLRLVNGNLLTTTAHSLRLAPGAMLLSNGLAGIEDDSHSVRGSLTQQQAMHGTDEDVNFGNMGFTLNPHGQDLTLTVDRRSGLDQLNYSYGESREFVGKKGIDRIWRLSTTGGRNPAKPVTLSLAWLAVNDHGLDFGTGLAQVWRSTNQGKTWAKEGEPRDASRHLVAVNTTQLNTWYTVSLSTKAAMLLAQTTFTGTARSSDAVLTWSTTTKPSNGWYVIERSVDQQQWREINRQSVAAQQWSPAASTAIDKDAGKLATTLFYRLRQLDTNGSIGYSKVVTIKFAGPAVFKFEAYPIPLQEFLTLDLTTTDPGLVQIDLYDMTGRLVISRKENVMAGSSRFQLDVHALATGVYTLRAHQGNQYFTRMLKRD